MPEENAAASQGHEPIGQFVLMSVSLTDATDNQKLRFEKALEAQQWAKIPHSTDTFLCWYKVDSVKEVYTSLPVEMQAALKQSGAKEVKFTFSVSQYRPEHYAIGADDGEAKKVE